MKLVCDLCGTGFDSEDDSICPNCGSVSVRKEDE